MAAPSRGVYDHLYERRLGGKERKGNGGQKGEERGRVLGGGRREGKRRERRENEEKKGEGIRSWLEDGRKERRVNEEKEG